MTAKSSSSASSKIPTFYIDFEALQKGDPDYKSTTRDVEKLINELREEDIDGLIVDLRNNGGGSLREANELVGLFIQRGPTVQIRDASGRVDILGDFDPKGRMGWSHGRYRQPPECFCLRDFRWRHTGLQPRHSQLATAPLARVPSRPCSRSNTAR